MSVELEALQRDIGKVFGVCVNILNSARSFEDLAIDLEFLAANGAIQACRINSAQGKPLIVLARGLSEVPTQIKPEIEELERQCSLLARKVAVCSLAARRYHLYTKTLQNCLPQEYQEQLLMPHNLTRKLERILKQIKQSDLEPKSKANLVYLMVQNNANATHVARLLQESLDILATSARKLQQIKMIGITAKSIGIYISINAASLQSGGLQFNSLVADIYQMAEQLEKKYEALLNYIEHGRRWITSLRKQRNL
ncbi:hypothetical protein WDW89_23965 [Deltaproteobacteria bacterium TL4]